MCSFLEWKDCKIVYKRYASLYFCCAVESNDNELLTLEIIHRYVELLDKYFGSVCELDIIFNFEKAYFILDELLIGGELQEVSLELYFIQGFLIPSPSMFISDIKEECFKSHCSPRCFTGGKHARRIL